MYRGETRHSPVTTVPALRWYEVTGETDLGWWGRSESLLVCVI